MSAWPFVPDRRLLGSRNDSIGDAVDGNAALYCFFGIIGLNTDVGFIEYGSREFGYFERVTRAPSSGTLYRALSTTALADALIRYTGYITYQLAIKVDEGLEAAASLALRIISALRVRTRIDLLVPAYLSVSWNDLERAIPGSCTGETLEDIPIARNLTSESQADLTDFEWLWKYGDHFEDLLLDYRFKLAVESLCYCHLLRDSRMMAAGLWAGIEALCGVKEELKFRISLLASAILEARGERRLNLFKRIQKLYDVRSKAVHGASISEDELAEHVVEVRILLAQLIVRSVEERKVFERDDFERALLVT